MERKITGHGVAVGGVAPCLVVAGLLFGEAAAMALGVLGLLLLGASALLAPRNLRRLELELECSSRFFATRSIPLNVKLVNPRRLLDAWAVELSLRFPHEVERKGRANWTPARGGTQLRERLSIPARANVSKVEVELHSRFPLGLFAVRRKLSVACPMMVYPRLITPPELLLDSLQPDHHPISGAGLGDLFGEPRGIRLYQPGDKATRIHQPASARAIARGQGLQVRASDPPGFHPSACRIVFHSAAKAGEIIRLDRFERALSLAAGALAHFQAKQTKLVFQADFANWRACPCESRSQSIACHALLASAERAQTKPQQLAEFLQQIPAEEQLVIISDSPAENWAHLVPPSHRGAVLINIRQVRFKGRRMQLQALNN